MDVIIQTEENSDDVNGIVSSEADAIDVVEEIVPSDRNSAGQCHSFVKRQTADMSDTNGLETIVARSTVSIEEATYVK